MNELFSVKDKVVLVTGGSRGIGLMIARGFVEAGAKVYISSRKKQVCDEVARELSGLGSCISVPADLSSEAGVQQLAGEIAGRESSLHVLVNNAGANWGAPFTDYPASAFDKLFALNVKAVFLLTRELVPLLEKAARPGDPARVINVGSADGIRPPALEVYAYGASKAALHHLTRHLARKLSGQLITVNAVAPGPFESKMMEATLEKLREQVIAAVPLRRIGEPEDMAGVAIYLASRAGAYVTGTLISVDGGMATCG